MSLDPSILGVLFGAGLGIISFVIIQMVATKVETSPGDQNQTQSDKRKIAQLLRSIAWLDIVIFAVVGYFVGPLIISS